MINKGIRIRPWAFLRDICMTLLVIWLTNPYQDFINIWFVYGGLWIVWCFCAFQGNASAFKYMISNKFSLIVFLWPILMMFLGFLGWANFAVFQFTIPLIFVCFTYYAASAEYSSIKWFIFVFLVYVVIININSIIRINEIPRLARILASSDQTYTAEYASPFTANFEHVNNLAFLSISLVACLKSKLLGKKEVMVAILLFVNFIYTMIKAQYATALLIAFVFAILIFYLGEGKKNAIILRIVIMITFGILLYSFLGPLLTWFASLIPEGIVQQRISELGSFFSAGTMYASSDIGKRQLVYGISIETIKNHPLIGVGGAVFKANGLVGGHSLLLDYFAYYGCIIGAFFIYMLIAAYKNIRVFFSHFKSYYALVFIAYFIDCCLNLCYRPEMIVVVYFIIPSIFLILERRKVILLER